MRIRSITYFCNPIWPLSEQVLREAGNFIRSARTAFVTAGFEVQTTRLATIPFPELAPVQQVPEMAINLERLIISEGIDNLSLGTVRPDELEYYPVIVEALAATRSTFFTATLAQKSNTPYLSLSLPAIRASSEIISKAATLSPDGFANLRFGALANVNSGSPFFPAAYHEGSHPAFALAIEAADLAVNAFYDAPTLAEGRNRLLISIEANAKRLETLARDLAKSSVIQFKGLDFTLAPFPEELRSIGTAIERIGVPAVGYSGSLAAAAILTETLGRAHFTRTGFNGLMLPVLEDMILAARAADGLLTVNDLLMYSAVCGTGLDTIPLPGDTPPEHIAALLLDIAALALRLNKPLTARLMPVPGKIAGEMTNFNFPYFVNSRILSLRARELRGYFAGNESFEIRPLTI
jgi:uncharacterized protein (UPF0210 family)